MKSKKFICEMILIPINLLRINAKIYIKIPLIIVLNNILLYIQNYSPYLKYSYILSKLSNFIHLSALQLIFQDLSTLYFLFQKKKILEFFLP
ncbi:hypothetical protein CNEO2_220077 [Clostridium neonatale]|nr:hypothetical protein CNEO2_220077 [Clostridium neonatale]